MIALLFIAMTAHAADPDWTALFFPESKSWTSIADTPKAKLEHTSELAASYSKAHPIPDPECDLMSRIFKEDGFHAVDINGDGKPDLVYVGTNPCGETNVTYTWLDGVSTKEFPFELSNGRIIRAKAGPNPSIVAQNPGCCDMHEDAFFEVTQDGRKDASIVHGTQFPTGILDRPHQATSRKELIVRTNPKIDDAYDYEGSMHLETALFGNIVSKYRAAIVTVLAEQTVGKTNWFFVLVPDTNNHQRYYSSSTANSGWVLSSQLK